MSLVARLRHVFTHNLGLKSLALVLATLAFLYSHGEQDHEATFVVPVEYLFPADLVPLNDDPLPEQVVIVASGTRTQLARVQERQLRYVVDLEKAEPGTTEYSFRQPPSSFPERVRISTVSPAMIRFVFDEQARRTVAVQLRVRGDLPAGFIETSRRVEPAEVVLAGARSELKGLAAISTTPLRLKSLAQGFDGELALDTTGLHLLPDSATSVGVRLEVKEVQAVREFGVVPVALAKGLSDQVGLVVDPTAALVTLRGPVPVLDGLRSENLRVEVGGPAARLPAEGGEASVRWGPGPRPEGDLGVVVRIEHPRAQRVQVMSVEPETILLRGAGSSPDEGGDGPPPAPVEDEQ